VTLAAVRRNLADAVRARDHATRDRETLALRLAGIEGDLSRSAGTESDLSETLGAVSIALADTIRKREAAEAAIATLNAEVAALEEQDRIEAQQLERAIGRIEEAVVFSLGKMQDTLASTGFDVDKMLAQLRETHSGEGGPFVELSPASALTDDDPQMLRLASLMTDLERVELMRMAAEKLPLAIPVKGTFRFTSGFGTRKDPRNGRLRQHEGIDFAGTRGTPITATAEGTVIFAGRMSGYGNVIKIRHAFGVETLYAHLNRIRVTVGEQVSQGEHIGDMGNTGRSTGVHLHYEVRLNGTPVNPMTYLKAARDVL
jgi:murein DD-endopeptidase MepM/ murein hydrolase activator NlpD